MVLHQRKISSILCNVNNQDCIFFITELLIFDFRHESGNKLYTFGPINKKQRLYSVRLGLGKEIRDLRRVKEGRLYNNNPVFPLLMKNPRKTL